MFNRTKFNWVERILDNERIPKCLRALFGVVFVTTSFFLVAVFVFLVSGEPIVWTTMEFNGAMAFGLVGWCIWYWIFYKLCGWSDDIKAKENKNEG